MKNPDMRELSANSAAGNGPAVADFPIKSPNPLDRREFLKLSGLGFVALVDRWLGLSKVARQGSASVESFPPDIKELVTEVLKGNPDAVIHTLKKGLKVSPDGIKPYLVKNENDAKKSWNFSLVSALPDWSNSLLNNRQIEDFSQEFQKPPQLVQINLKEFQLDIPQFQFLQRLLGGNKSIQLKQKLVQAGLAAGGAGLLIKGGADVIDGISDVVNLEDSDGKAKLAKGAAEGAIGIGVMANAAISDTDYFKSLNAQEQEALKTIAVALFPPAWVTACVQQDPSLLQTATPVTDGNNGDGSNSGNTEISQTAKPALPPEATPSPNPPEKNVPYPGDMNNLLWNETVSDSNTMQYLESNETFREAANEIEKIYYKVAENQNMVKADIDFVGSIGPESWVIAMKYQGKFFVMQYNGLNIAPITPYGLREEFKKDPSTFNLIELKLDQLPKNKNYTVDDLVIVADQSTYHVFATKDGNFYFDMSSDIWRDKNGTPAQFLEILPTPSTSNFEVANWAEKDGRFDPFSMYPLVGSVNHVNRKYIDLNYSGLRIALLSNDDLTQIDDLAQYKGNQASQINNNLELKSQLELIKQQVNQSNNNTIVVNNGQVSQVIETDKIYNNVISRYFWENGSLRQMTKEEEPLLMAPLSAPDHRFIRTDTGEQVMMRGVHILHFSWSPEVINVDVDSMENLLNGVKEMGANYIVMQWNSGFVDNPDYVNKLVDTLKLAKNKYGFRVQLDLWARGLEGTTPDHIEIVDSQITDDWRKLLSNPETAFWIGRTVDIFTVISEPTHNIQGQGNPSFFDPVLSETSEVVRSSINNPNAIIGYSAGRWGWAGDADELLGHDRSELGKEITINIHPYRYSGSGEGELISKDSRSDPKDYVIKLQDAGWNISVGEYGWLDWKQDPDYLKKLFRFFEDNKISYAVFGTGAGYNTTDFDGEGFLFSDTFGGQLSPTGEYIKDFWSQYINSNED